MNVLGLDLSLTSTGIALPDGTTLAVTTEAGEPLEVRLDRIVATVQAEIAGITIHLAVIEDLPRNAMGAGATGPVHGAVRLDLYRRGIRIARPAPASLKTYALGKGSGKGTNKDAMGIAAMKHAGLDFSGRNDECDAWWLRAMGLDQYGEPVVELPETHRRALAGVAWPDLEVIR